MGKSDRKRRSRQRLPLLDDAQFEQVKDWLEGIRDGYLAAADVSKEQFRIGGLEQFRNQQAHYECRAAAMKETIHRLHLEHGRRVKAKGKHGPAT